MGRPRIYSIEEARERHLQWQREYRKKYPDRRKAVIDRYNESHKEENAARKKAWFERNPGYMREYHGGDKERKALTLFKAAKARAQKFGLPFNLNVEDVAIPDFCPVLGIPLEFGLTKGFKARSPSLDRLIPELGYVRGNVRVISLRANTIKRDATAEELIKVANYVSRATAVNRWKFG